MPSDTHAILSGFIETAPDAMILVRADGTIVEANRRAGALFGVPDSLVGHGVEELLPDGVAQRHRGHRERYMRDPTPRPMGTGLQLRARRLDGSEFDVDVSLGLIDVDGQQLVSAALRDVTDRVEAQRALASSAYIVDHSHDAIYSLDADGVITTWNHTAELLTGRDGTEMMGARTRHPLGLVDPGEEDVLIARAERGELIHRHRTELRRTDGLTVPIDLSLSAIRDDRNRVVGMSGIARDITEETTTQQTLAEVQQRLAETQRLARIGLWLLEIDSGEVQWSSTLYELTGISPLDFGADLDSFLAIVADEDRERVAKEFRRSLDDGTPLQLEFPVIHRNGDRRWFLCRGVADVDESGAVRSLQGICQDLTERQRLLEALQEADRMKDEFLATVSHELRTPLTSIVGFSHLLREQIDGEHARWLDVVVRNGEEMNSMVERILDFSRLQSGRLGLSAEEVTGPEIVSLVLPPGRERPGRAPPRGRRRRLGGRRRRPQRAQADPGESAHQRGQVRRAGHDRAPRDPRRRRRGRVPRGRPGDRHRARAPRRDLRALPPGAEQPDGVQARRRRRPVHREGLRRGAGGHRFGQQRGRRRVHLRGPHAPGAEVTGRMVRSVLVVAVCYAVVEHLHDLAKFLRMREVSRSDYEARPPTAG